MRLALAVYASFAYRKHFTTAFLKVQSMYLFSQQLYCGCMQSNQVGNLSTCGCILNTFSFYLLSKCTEKTPLTPQRRFHTLFFRLDVKCSYSSFSSDADINTPIDIIITPTTVYHPHESPPTAIPATTPTMVIRFVCRHDAVAAVILDKA